MRTTLHFAAARTFAVAALLGLTLGLAAPVRAETTLCTAITSLPTTITVQGIYCLTSDFSLNLPSGAAIEIDTNNVVIDLNGHKIGNLAAGPATQAYGIYAYQRQNITIKNGTIRGFLVGIWLDDITPYTTSQGHLVEDIRADQNTFVGIEVHGRGNLVRRTQVVSTGGSTTGVVDGFGIYVTGPGNRVVDNDVITVTTVGGGVSYGIYFGSSPANGVAVNNRITDAGYGIYMNAASIKYRDNLTTGVTTAYSGGTNAGNNN